VAALTLSFSEIARKAFPWIVLPRIGTVPRWGAIAVVFVAMDGCNWFAHLANHRVRMLWRFHELHHSQEDLNVLTVFRTHPLIHVSYLIALIPGVVLLANGAVSTSLLVIYGGILAFEHSNTNLGFGPLGRIFVRTDTGLPGRPLIVEQAAPRPRHFSVFAAQLIGPFRPLADRTDLPLGQAHTHRPEGEADRISPRSTPQVDVTAQGCTAQECEVA
jgi:hypothetical protein